MSLAVSKPVLKATALTKRYGKARGIEHVSFEVSAGEVFGFLGPNGAGKTTTMRVFMDAIRPTSGRAEIFGLARETASAISIAASATCRATSVLRSASSSAIACATTRICGAAWTGRASRCWPSTWSST